MPNPPVLQDAPIRWIVDDCMKFVEREIRRGNHYDAIIMDPPILRQRAEGGDLEDRGGGFPADCSSAAKLLTERAAVFPGQFLYHRTAAGGAALYARHGTLNEVRQERWRPTRSGLPVTASGLALPCGASGRWEA